ncbi:SLAP domain-containing protein [Lactobacillus amylovorus]|uniref:SLAP domain-containing protein n=1 Tax=Lactobacillus amylovorus TaxID=1604 RepID=UPI0023305385|nr:SLAP domain-containing protein [Lactobacillus amylovorus]MDB6229713.1 SLAP domain-containing protein [Lactobacillus amylovorus]
MIKYAYLHLNFEDDVIVGNLSCFCCALFTASEKSRRKEPTQPPLSKITPTPAAQNTDVNLATNFTAIAYVAGQNSAQGTNGVVSGSVTATYNGQSYTGNLQYYAVINDVSFNFGSQNADKKLTVSLKGGLLTTKDADAQPAESVTVTLNKDGVADFAQVKTPIFKAVNPFSTSTVAWYQNNNVVTSANVTVNAGNNNLVNVSQIVAALNGYTAYELTRGENGKVDSKSVTSPITATANNSNASAELPVTVSIPNGKVTTVESVSKTIMHNAYYYDKDAKRVGTDKLTRYNSVTVSPKTTTINGKAYYEVVENGKLSGKYINADNIDGTERTLKHNAYVYKTSKKRANKVVLKKGDKVTTYGGTYTFQNGKQYYKIGNNTEKTYVKASNF